MRSPLRQTGTPERSIRPLPAAYVGAAWYRKEVVLPREWAGKQVWLKSGGVNAQGWFWVNGQYVGHLDRYCGTYKYNITDLVKPGERAVLVAKVRNDVPSRKGLMNWIERFGGLYRSVELDATPGVLIDDAHVVGELDQHRCVVHVNLRAVRDGAAPAGPVEVQVKVTTSSSASIRSGDWSRRGVTRPAPVTSTGPLWM